jgi:hypothetical protein
LAKYSLLKLFSSQKLTGNIAEAHKGLTTERPRRISFEDRLSAFGAALAFAPDILAGVHTIRSIAFTYSGKSSLRTSSKAVST